MLVPPNDFVRLKLAERKPRRTFGYQGCDCVQRARVGNLCAQHVAWLVFFVDLFDFRHDR